MANPEALYRLPFDTRQHPLKIMQGWNGPWSHKIYYVQTLWSREKHDLRYAVDFELPIGSAVLAARAGRVIGVVNESKDVYQEMDPEIGNNMPSTNLVTVGQDDGTFACYSHLGHHQTVVQKGQAVRVGQLLAYTGLSGWVGDTPHLHFHVIRTEIIKIAFIDYSGPLEHSDLFPSATIQNYG